MIKAVQETKKNRVRLEVTGDKGQNENELIGVLISALDVFSEEDIIDMLITAKTYKNTNTSNDSFIM